MLSHIESLLDAGKKIEDIKDDPESFGVDPADLDEYLKGKTLKEFIRRQIKSLLK